MSRSEGSALIRPLERFCHPERAQGVRAVVVFDKGQNLAFQILHRNKVASFQNFSNQDAEPNFDLVHPGGVLGGVMKNNAVSWVAQKGSS